MFLVEGTKVKVHTKKLNKHNRDKNTTM